MFLSEEAMMASRSFMTSVVVGKDIVPRIGLNQLEILRQDIMATIKKSRFSLCGNKLISSLYSQTPLSMGKLTSVKRGVADRNPLIVCGIQTLLTRL